MRGTRGAAVALIAALALALPVAAQGHPFTTGTAFMPELPEVTFEQQGAQGLPATYGGPPPAAYDVSGLRFLGFSPRPAPTLNLANSDLAFQDDRAYQGTFQGFRILDLDRRGAEPEEIINYTDCASNAGQGDVVVYGDILTRSWDAAAPEGSTCDGQPVPAGTQGLHVFDISDEGNPELVAYIPTQCGSHTATGVPDPRNRRLVIYSTPSSAACPGIDIIEIPLRDPSRAAYVRFAAAGTPINCHDTGVILGRIMRAACAGGQGFAVWSMSGSGASITNPQLLYRKDMKTELGININTGHSAAFSNDGKTLIFGHEPNGGTSPRCQPTGTPLPSTVYPVQTDDMKSFFFFDAASGALLGKWTLPRDQTEFENCTLHNYNIVPTRKRDILVHGSYQSGIGVLDFSDPANAVELAYADPKPIDPTTFTIGGDWSSHYYNGRIYQSDITRGFLSWEYLGRELRGAKRLDRLNPQTQEYTAERRGRGWWWED